MDTFYDDKAIIETKKWMNKIERKQSFVQKYAKTVQGKINDRIPDHVHQLFTTAIKNMIQATIVGSQYTSTTVPLEDVSLKDREMHFEGKLKSYKKAAAIEGIGTGAGGILLGMADFPLLLSIKMKFLFEVASIYGFDVKDYRERLYILHLFQLAFSSDERKKEVLGTIKNWQQTCDQLPEKEVYLQSIDWRTFQLEYRDHIDLIKLFQMIPGIGAIIGGLANYHFLEVLGETAKHGYRMRLLTV